MEIENLKLQKQIDELIDKIYPVGSYYETSNGSFNPNDEWGGTWEEDTPGLVTVALYNLSHPNPSGIGVPINLGQIVGEAYHTLTIEELPAHRHGITTWRNNDGATWGAGASSTEYGAFSNVFSEGDGTNQSTGDNPNWQGINMEGLSEAHNNIQPSIGVYRWHRTA